MRIVGIILVILGALGLGWQGLASGATERPDTAETTREVQQTIWVPPTVSGIAVVSGLLLLASAGRREEL
ncbi:hypothetical protein [Gemmata obscuriglobus]|uniref:DUF3185 domain-containing protein n=1 Tax=Gemmata obscuriglobus TaxID=114 RepID=A0A2Z3GWC4_9BACT|nr:hypothetical protein [Gemmata obscuriglobus]AWM38739.1 hypothetical protein C1280_18245 [Gemmata obscuriglobus]